MKRLLLFFLTAGLLAAEPPNLVLILADDLGWSDLGVYGNPWIDSPHLDRLAAEGVRFTDAYTAAPVCAPTRVSILTGQYPARIGMPMLTRPHRRPWAKLTPPENRYALPTDAATLAPELARAGYVSTLIGKWHLGYGNRPHDLSSFEMPPGYGPKTAATAFGFIRPPSGGAVLVRPDWAGRFGRQNPGKGVGPQTARAVEFLETRGEGPFFLFLSYSIVHLPMQARDELVEKYRKRLEGRDAGVDPRYAAMVEAMDESVGVVLDALERTGATDDTAVFFFSDNGGLTRVYHGDGPQVSTNAPLRSEKGALYEGGVRVPLIARWPGVFRENVVERTPVISTDLLPTFLELAGLELPEAPIDGVSLAGLLRDGEEIEREALYWHYPAYHHSTPASAIRMGRWKLIEFFEDGRRELYDLAADPGESEELSRREPKRAAALGARLAAWRGAIEAGLPTPNPYCDPEREGVWGVRPENPWEPAPREALVIQHVE